MSIQYDRADTARVCAECGCTVRDGRAYVRDNDSGATYCGAMCHHTAQYGVQPSPLTHAEDSSLKRARAWEARYREVDWGSMALLEERAAPAWYVLPEGWTWKRVAEARFAHDVQARFFPLASAGGAVAWGRPQP